MKISTQLPIVNYKLKLEEQILAIAIKDENGAAEMLLNSNFNENDFCEPNQMVFKCITHNAKNKSSTTKNNFKIFLNEQKNQTKITLIAEEACFDRIVTMPPADANRNDLHALISKFKKMIITHRNMSLLKQFNENYVEGETTFAWLKNNLIPDEIFIEDSDMDGCELIEKNEPMEPVLVEGRLRKGQIMNIIAPPKTGKSLLGMNFAEAVAVGGKFLGHKVRKGNVLLIDTEVQLGELSDRLSKVLDRLNIKKDEIRGKIKIRSLRGKKHKLFEIIDSIQRQYKHGELDLIIIDSIYSIFPHKFQENSNEDWAKIYAELQGLALATGAAVCVVHHTSKGNGSSKAVTDLGSGGGAISRACDWHLTILPHKYKTISVIQSVCRSFRQPEPICVRFDYPVWVDAPEFNPSEMLAANAKQKPLAEFLEAKAEPAARQVTEVETFARKYGGTKCTKASMAASAIADGMSSATAYRRFEQAVKAGWLKPFDGTDDTYTLIHHLDF